MPNGIKYSTGTTEAGCLRKGNMLISNNTADTGNAFYTGINPPVGGYTIYLNKASGGPSIYCPTNDTQLISIANQISPTLNYMSNGGNFSNGTFSPFVYDYSDSGGTTQIVDISNDRPYVGSNDTKALELNYNGGRVMDTNGLLTVGRTYTFSFWAKITSGSYFGVSWNNQNGSGDTNNWSNGMSFTTSWQRYSQIFTYNAARLYFYFYSRFNISPNDGKALFTGFQLTETSASAGPGLTTAGEAINWFRSQTDKLCVNFNYEGIVTNGLVLNLDAGFRSSISTLPINTVGNNYSNYYPVWYDLSGNGNDGYLVNGPTFNSANSGSVVFDGTNDYVDCGSNASLDLGSFTQEVWFKPTIGRRNPLFGDSNSNGSDSVHAMWLELYNNNRFILIFGDGSTYGDVYSTTTVQNNNIIHIVCIRNNTSKTVQFYINGVAESSQAWANQGTIGTPVTLGTYNLWVGGSNGFGNMKDNIYVARIYNRILTPSEITQNYNAQKGRFGL